MFAVTLAMAVQVLRAMLPWQTMSSSTTTRQREFDGLMRLHLL